MPSSLSQLRGGSSLCSEAKNLLPVDPNAPGGFQGSQRRRDRAVDRLLTECAREVEPLPRWRTLAAGRSVLVRGIEDSVMNAAAEPGTKRTRRPQDEGAIRFSNERFGFQRCAVPRQSH